MAALHVAEQAVADAGWTSDDLKHAGIVLGTSRGNAAGCPGAWPGRRSFKLMAASNTIHCEPASAISIGFGITGPCHVVASGCAAGLDAIGLAMMLLHCGMAERVLAVGVELPLIPAVLDSYASSGLLADGFRPDPYSPRANGFIPAEGAAAMALEKGKSGIWFSHYASNSDAADALGTPSDGGRAPELFENHPPPAALCPHATGTAVQAIAEQAMMKRILGNKPTGIHLLKPWLGHCIGASGMVETMLLTAFLREGNLPPNRPGLTFPAGMMAATEEIPCGGSVAKLSHSMGGHNALLVLEKTRN